MISVTRASPVLITIGFAVAILIATSGAVRLAAVRNGASLAYLTFAINPGWETLPALDQSAAGYAHYAAAAGTSAAHRRAAQIADRSQRYSASGSAAAEPIRDEAAPCTDQNATLHFSVDTNAVEWSRAIAPQLTWLRMADGRSPSTALPCRMPMPRTVAVENLAWRGEDLAILPTDDVPGYGSGTRTQELRTKTRNRLDTVARNGRTATVFALENRVAVDNVIMSHPIPIDGGTYLLGGWIKTSNLKTEAWLGIVCTTLASSKQEQYTYVARRFTSLEWTDVNAMVDLEDGQKCRILMLNYGAPGTAWFDEIVLAQLPSDYATNGN
jgi:hypothetical protein